MQLHFKDDHFPNYTRQLIAQLGNTFVIPHFYNNKTTKSARLHITKQDEWNGMHNTIINTNITYDKEGGWNWQWIWMRKTELQPDELVAESNYAQKGVKTTLSYCFTHATTKNLVFMCLLFFVCFNLFHFLLWYARTLQRAHWLP